VLAAAIDRNGWFMRKECQTQLTQCREQMKLFPVEVAVEVRRSPSASGELQDSYC
jgi:hypothetical protein